MLTLETRRFGALVVPDDGLFERRECVVGGRRLERTLFISTPLDDPRVIVTLDGLDGFDERARAALEAERAAGTSTALEFVAFHRDEVPETFARVGLGASDADFLRDLDLVGLSIHPDAEHGFTLTLDYSPGRALTDQLLAVHFAGSGALLFVAHES